jgi:hypothetical protein
MTRDTIRRTLDRLAYASLLLDICIAVITLLTILDVQQSQRFLVPINYLLTTVVILSVVLFLVLLAYKSKEKLTLKKRDASLLADRRAPEPSPD